MLVLINLQNEAGLIMLQESGNFSGDGPPGIARDTNIDRVHTMLYHYAQLSIYEITLFRPFFATFFLSFTSACKLKVDLPAISCVLPHKIACKGFPVHDKTR